jgi:hypothetical protein
MIPVSTDPNVTDWITALASVFAAVGTVGAVIVALWQVNRQSRRSLVVRCSSAVTGDPQFSRVISLGGTNDGSRPVKLNMAYLRAVDGRQVFARFTPFSDELPKVLEDGESVQISWSQPTLSELAEKEGVQYLYAYFTDTLGQVFGAPYPGVTEARVGLRRKKVYELPDGTRLGRKDLADS